MSRTRSVAGLTLVEVLVAGAVLTLTLSAFVTTFTMAKRAALLADIKMDRTHAARSQMEDIVSHAYSDPELSCGTHSFSNGTYVVSANAVYPGTKDIALTMYWRAPAGSATSVLTLATSVSESLHK